MPADAAGYKIEVADDLRPYLGDIVNDKGLTELRAFAAENKWSQGQLDDTFKLMNHFREKGFLGESFDPAAEVAALGANGRARQQEQEVFLTSLKEKGVLDDKAYGELMMLVPTAAGTIALENLRKHFGPQGGPTVPDVPSGAPTNALEEAKAMRRDPRYETDAKFRADAERKWMDAFRPT